MRRALSEGVDISERDLNGRSPLHVAALAALTTAEEAQHRQVDTTAMTSTDHLPNGTRISVSGLSSRSEYNGQLGAICSWDGGKRRYGVELDSGDGLLLKPSNLKRVTEADGEDDGLAMLRMLTEAAESQCSDVPKALSMLDSDGVSPLHVLVKARLNLPDEPSPRRTPAPPSHMAECIVSRPAHHQNLRLASVAHHTLPPHPLTTPSYHTLLPHPLTAPSHCTLPPHPPTAPSPRTLPPNPAI